MKTTYKIGDLVQHTSKFLRNICWFTNVPKNGKVVFLGLDDSPSMRDSGDYVRVQWCDRMDGDTTLINAANIEHTPTFKRLSDTGKESVRAQRW